MPYKIDDFEKEEEESARRFKRELQAREKAKKSATKLPTEKRHKDDYKRLKGNIQKSRSDLHVNKKTGKREITTNMTIHKGLTVKEKAALKKSILNAVKQHLSGSGLHIPLAGGYTSSLIFHEMGKYIPPKDRVLMQKLIEESRPPRPPPIHSGAIDEEVPLVVVPPMDPGNYSDSDYEGNDTESESDREIKYKFVPKTPNTHNTVMDSDSDDVMMGMGFNPIEWGMKTAINNATQGLKQVGSNYLDAAKRDLNRTRVLSNKVGNGIKRPRGRPRKIQL